MMITFAHMPETQKRCKHCNIINLGTLLYLRRWNRRKIIPIFVRMLPQKPTKPNSQINWGLKSIAMFLSEVLGST